MPSRFLPISVLVPTAPVVGLYVIPALIPGFILPSVATATAVAAPVAIAASRTGVIRYDVPPVTTPNATPPIIFDTFPPALISPVLNTHVDNTITDADNTFTRMNFLPLLHTHN